MFLNIPEIAHVASIEELFLAHEGEQPFAQDQRRQTGVGFIQQGLVAQEVVLTALVNGIEKFAVEQRARQDFGVGDDNECCS